MWNICGNSKLDFIFSGERVFYVDELGVNRLYRNRGIGKSLTGELIRSAKEKGIKSAVLRTNIIAEPAIAVYGKMGFINLNVYDEKYPDRTYWSKDLT
jgi:ribosomal protein S18 acetylase RimI-like enzyme